MMQLVEQPVIRKGDARYEAIDQAAFASKNLYNAALYEVRQAFIFRGVYLNYHQMHHLMKAHPAASALPAKVSQQVLRTLDKNGRSFFKAIAEWREHPERFKGRPCLPNSMVYNKDEVDTAEEAAFTVASSRFRCERACNGPRGETKQTSSLFRRVCRLDLSPHPRLPWRAKSELAHLRCLTAKLIVQGTQDTTVLPAQSQELQQPLLRNHVPVQYISYNGGHSFLNMRQDQIASIFEQEAAYLVAQEHP